MRIKTSTGGNDEFTELLIHSDSFHGDNRFIDSSKNNIAISVEGAADISGGNDKYTVLLIHSNHDNNSTTFTDTSFGGSSHSVSTSNAFHQTRTSNPRIPPKFGSSSIRCDANAYITVADHADWTFGTADFTIDYWVYFQSGGGTEQMFFSTVGWGAQMWKGNHEGSATNVWGFANVDLGQMSLAIDSGKRLVRNEWHHIAHVRYNSLYRTYINGIGVHNWVADTQNYNLAALYWGANFGDGTRYYTDGAFQEIRISKGIARWNPTGENTDFFVPPTQAYETSVLHSSVDYLDQTVQSGAYPSHGAKFNKTGMYFPGTAGIYVGGQKDEYEGFIGGSNKPFHLGKEAWTFDCWIMMINNGSIGTLIEQYDSSGNWWQLFVEQGGTVRYYCKVGNASKGYGQVVATGSGNLLQYGRWHHLEFSRRDLDANGFLCFVDGKIAHNFGAMDTDIPADFEFPDWDAPLQIGINDPFGYGQFGPGYLDEIRFSKGICRHTAEFEPPVRAYGDPTTELGTELTTNGDFDSNITGWTNGSVGSSTCTHEAGSTSPKAGGRMKLVSNGSDDARGYQSISCVLGTEYEIATDWLSPNALGNVKVGTSANDTTNLNQTGCNGSMRTTFIATATSTFITLVNGQNNTAFVDNVTVREIRAKRGQLEFSADEKTLKKFDGKVWAEARRPVTRINTSGGLIMDAGHWNEGLGSSHTLSSAYYGDYNTGPKWITMIWRGSGNLYVPSDTPVDIFMVGGGGAGGSHHSGGGGGGGCIAMDHVLLEQGDYAIVIGTGANGPSGGAIGGTTTFQKAGSPTSGDTARYIEVIGGGSFGEYNGSAGRTGANGGGGGTSGGAGQIPASFPGASFWGQNGGIRYYGGYNGGTGNGVAWSGGGGGGGGGVGEATAGWAQRGGDGGIGIQHSWVTPRALGFTGTLNDCGVDTPLYWAGGGGAFGYNNDTYPGDGGRGGGGTCWTTAYGQNRNGAWGTHGLTISHNKGSGGFNTGGGAASGDRSNTYTGPGNNSGGSGIFILRYSVL